MTVFDLIDSHQHVWDQSRFSYSWTAGVPKLNRSFVYSAYAEAVRELPAPLRLVKSVHVEADPDEEWIFDETEWLESLADEPGCVIAGLVAGCRPEEEDFDEQLEELVEASPHLKGLRRVLHTQPDDLAKSVTFEANVGLLQKYDLPFDLCVLARQLPVGIGLVEACEGTKFILDHCGVPDVKGKGFDPWCANFSKLAEHDNVIGCKISGLVAYADSERWTPDDLRPFVDHALQCFGPDRLMFGSDWPVCTLTCSFAKWAETALLLTEKWSDNDRRKLFSENAKRVYRL